MTGLHVPVPRRKRWYTPILTLFRGRDGGPNRPPGKRPGRTALFAVFILAIVASALIGFGLARGVTWALWTGLGGVAVSALLLFVLTSSLERKLWAAFFSFLSGAAGSLTAPDYNFAIFAQVGDPNTGTGAAANGAVSSGGSVMATLLWFAGAIIAGLFALKVRRG